jgi:putative ABC transport system permease protein
MTTLRIALRNVTRQKKRSILLGGAIAFGVLIITLVQSFTGGLINTANARVTELLGGHLYVSGQEVSDSGRLISVIREQEPLDAALALIEDQTETVHFRSAAFGEMIFVSQVTSVSIDGVDWSNEPSLVESLEFVDGNVSAIEDPTAVIIPEPMAADLGVQVGETVLVRLNSITGQQTVGEFVVGGLLRDAGILGMESAYADKAYLNSLIGMTPDQYQQVVVGVRDTTAIDGLAATVESYLASVGKVAVEETSIFGDASEDMGPAGDGPPGGGAMMGGMGGIMSLNVSEDERWDGTQFAVATINDVMEPVMTIVNILNQVSLGLFLVLLVITMVGLLNTFRMILIERTREIGTIRAVGMQRKQVRNLFLTEAVILALGGAIGGLILALIAGTVVSNIPITSDTPIVMFLDGNTFAFPINIVGILGTLGILTVITLLSAYLPARRAALMKPADALRTSY